MKITHKNMSGAIFISSEPSADRDSNSNKMDEI